MGDIIRDFPDEDPRPAPHRAVPLGPAREIPPGTCARFVVSGLPVAVFNVDGRFFACKDRCPHMAARLSQGRLEGSVLTCFMHGWRIDVRDGSCPGRPSARVETYRVRVRDGTVEADLPAPVDTPGSI